MARAWGSAWGSAWGASWGATTTTATRDTGAHGYRARRPRKDETEVYEIPPAVAVAPPPAKAEALQAAPIAPDRTIDTVLLLFASIAMEESEWLH